MPDNLDPRTCVLIGAGQISNRVDQGDQILEPVDLMVEAARRAGADAGVPGALTALDSVRVIMLLSWRYRNPGALVAERLGADPDHTGLTVMGGNYVQTLVNRTALDIAEGRTDLVLLTGAEAWRSRSAAKAEGGPTWTVQPGDTPPPEQYGDDADLSSPDEVGRGLFLPIQLYPMFDVALRAADGLGIDEHRRRIAALWSRFSEVAERNPNAWIQRRYTAEELAEPGPDNRMVGFPYTKLLNSNNNVEQGAALLLCSVERARALGVPEDRWVFLHAGADAHDHWFVSNRESLCASPAIRSAGGAALELAGIGVDDLAHIDLYSCFPSAVQVAARELGLGLDRDLTVTGGMSFAGGPWNNYSMHGIATMAGVLRADPGSFGLTSANGGYLTKHAFGVWSTDPPTAGAFRWRDTQAEVDARPARELATDHTGPVTIEAYVVMHDRDSVPEKAFAATLLDDGRRAWATVDDPGTLGAMCTQEFVGHPATLAPDGTLEPD